MASNDFRLSNPPRHGLGPNNCLETPAGFFGLLTRDFGPFDLDVCASPESAKCARYFTAARSCLEHEWGELSAPARGFCNPPYAETADLIGPIIAKALAEALAGRCSTLCLFPAKKSEFAWYHECVIGVGGPGASMIMPVEGRLDFCVDGQPLGMPNHASVLVDFRVGLVGTVARHLHRLPWVGSYHRTEGLRRERAWRQIVV